MLIAITGATGVNLAVKMLNILKKKGIYTELIISKAAEKVIELELKCKISEISHLASKSYDVNDLTAGPASGSYRVDSMIVIPCSMKTLAAVACGYSDNLITRAADVVIKEHQKLVLVVRECPFSAIHLENMLKLARLGVIITPPIPSFYTMPNTIDELLENIISKILDQVNIDIGIKRWQNEKKI